MLQDARKALPSIRKFAPQWSWVLVALFAVWIVNGWLQANQTIAIVPYSTFEQYLRDGKLAEAKVGDGQITGKLKTTLPDDKATVMAEMVEPLTAERLSHYDVPYARVRDSNWLTEALTAFGPTLLLLGLWYCASRRMAGKGGAGLLGIGQSKAKVYMGQVACPPGKAWVQGGPSEIPRYVTMYIM